MSNLHALGRLVNHDPRSLNYLVAETDTPVSKSWSHYIPVLDQGNLGSCTGNATVGVLGTSPFYGKLYALRHSYPPVQVVLNEDLAVNLYSRATQIDPFEGDYPPTDTGSSGLAVAKAAQERGLITSYYHVTSLAAAHNAIKTGPFIVGSNWYEGFDTPGPAGWVKPTGEIRGGHEYACLGYSVTYKRWRFLNSWGPNWGKNGFFYYSDDTFARLLSEQGDATVFAA